MLWDSGVSFGCMAIWLLWGTSFAMILASMAGMHDTVGQLGLGVSAAAASLTIIRDNQRTRRMVRSLRNNDDVMRLR